MLQQNEPEDFVIATGEQHSVRDFVMLAGSKLGMNIRWQGKGADEVGIDAITGRSVVKVDKDYFRPAEVETLLGDPSKAKANLNWQAEIGFDELVTEMINADLKIAQRDAALLQQGFIDHRSRIAM
jgi:GDPmannose 4,6-dehydratase